MKLFIASDLHGSAEYCRQMIEAFANEKADKLLLLGDILYHGPRNDLPELYNPKVVIQMLEIIKDKIICVCGNCDAEIDREVLPFPVISDYGLIHCDGLNIYFAHGHKPEPHLLSGEVYLTGHTHVAMHGMHEGHFHLNPGSVSIPKGNSKRGYIVYENRKFVFKDLKGESYDEVEINEPQVAEEAPQEVKETVTEQAPAAPAAPRPHIVRRKFVVKRK